ncbi:MAG: putative ABC transporter permease [Acetivibrio ethanolgignens]
MGFRQWVVHFYFLVYNFFLYSFCGWIYESTLVSIQHKTWVNRGFLNGPIVPIYGAGATAVYLFLSGIPDEPVLIFVIGMLVATVLEYLTSYVMEKLFHAKWWDYSNYKYHFQGRICLLASLLWGFLSLLMMDVLQPFMNSVIASIPRRAGEIAGYFIFLLFGTDLTVTIIYTLQLDKKLEELSNFREEFMEYLEGTRLYETKEELRERFESLSVHAIGESMRARMENHLEKKEEIEARLHSFMQKYEKRAELGNIIEKRLLRAFPTMKSTRSEAIITELRKRKRG